MKTKKAFHLDILGDGSDRERIVSLVALHDLKDEVTFHGKVPMAEYYQMMANCDVVLNPALKEGAVTTAFDSMAFGRPLVCIDTGGYTRYFTDDYAVLIQRGGRQQVIEDLAAAMIRLANPGQRKAMGTKAREAARQYTWAQKGEEICQTIMEGLTVEKD